MSRHFALATMLIAVACGFHSLGENADAVEPARWTLSMKVDGRFLEGTPLSWDESNVFLLSREGRLHDFKPAAAKESRKSSATFQGYSAAEMRERLSKELGRGFEVTHTGHYLVAHPRGQKKDWAPRFEEMYRQFVHYFTVRGFALQEPEFPLVAIIWPTQQDFQRYAASEGSSMGPGYLGYYSARSNRVTLYDQQSGGGDSAANIDTVIHEVTHQTAYNTGVHRRFAETPRWLVEGLGTMFEPQGVWNARKFPKLDDRINRGRLGEFKSRRSARPAGLIAELISTDRMFESDTSTAYCEAWAFSFYLGEKMSRKYAEYLALTAKRPIFQHYPASERMKDFTSIFGSDLKLIESQYLRFMDELK
ncbi:MAG: DUF1570 domain-containing protein [Planctomycetia bacterium]|nr:DUF1570 domain-containing protein [Planctomycetia bacterium]